jgi:hypothetical protein
MMKMARESASHFSRVSSLAVMKQVQSESKVIRLLFSETASRAIRYVAIFSVPERDCYVTALTGFSVRGSAKGG